MSKNFTKADLKNIDYDATCVLNNGFALITRDLYGQFKFALKDGRIFCCKQDLDEAFMVNSSTEGTIWCNWWGYKATDPGYMDISEFVKKIKDIKKTAENLANKLDNIDPKEIANHKAFDIMAEFYKTPENMFIKIIEMGLNKKNRVVTIEPVIK